MSRNGSPGTPRAIGSAGDLTWTMEITPGVHHFASADGGAFEAKAYGVGAWTSYAVTLGAVRSNGGPARKSSETAVSTMASDVRN